MDSEKSNVCLSRKKRREKRLRKKRKAMLIVASLLIISAIGGTALAFLIDKTKPKKNVFTPSRVTCEVGEDFSNNIKSNVYVKNTGDTDAYIRAAVVVTWKDSNGNVCGFETPQEGRDYTISYSDDGWFRGSDGYYYYSKAVEVDGSTGMLIDKCIPVEDRAPKGYMLSVEIVSSAVQSSPLDVVAEVWSNVKVNNNGTLADKSN